MQAPSLFRRFAAMFYDFLLLLGILFLSTALVLPLNAGQAFGGEWFYLLYLLSVSFIFYGWFWTHSGQTLGLKAWKLRVLTREQKIITWWQAFLRFSSAILSWGMLGMGFVIALLNKEKRCLHDVFSKTDIFYKN